jgi:hypothetical protein
LDALEPVDQDATTWRPRISLFHWPLAIAFLCSTLLALSRLYNHGAFTSNTFRETAP